MKMKQRGDADEVIVGVIFFGSLFFLWWGVEKIYGLAQSFFAFISSC